MVARPSNSFAHSELVLWLRRSDPGISRGSAPKSSSLRTSINAGHFGVPIRRASLSLVIRLNDDMMRPFNKEDAILRHVASWGDRRSPCTAFIYRAQFLSRM